VYLPLFLSKLIFFPYCIYKKSGFTWWRWQNSF